MMESRFKQAHKEAIIAVVLTLGYLICWIVTAYCCSDIAWLYAMPLWFVLACLIVPIVFIFTCYFVVRRSFKVIPLDYSNSNEPFEDV